MVTVFDKFSKKISFEKLILPLEIISVQIGKPRSKTPTKYVHGWFFNFIKWDFLSFFQTLWNTVCQLEKFPMKKTKLSA